ncbi:MAG: patatin-like phospholipase family protein [Terracidiphilus sp.]|jgi:hypothetical protein
MAKFRILSLDGGGSWALIQVMALIDLYGGNATGHEVLRDFDLAAANSGGSIVLGGLVEDMSLTTLLNFFLSEEKRKSVFVEKPHLPDTPKYKTEEKLKGLQAALPQRGGWLLPQAAADIHSSQTGKAVHLLIAGFDYDRSRSRFFRSASASGPAWGDGDPAQVRLAEAIHASTNAPVLFFDKPAEFPSEPGRRYWDGAISGCNNPVLAGVTEAIVLGQAPDSIVALAIGTGTVCLPPAPAGAPAEVFYAPLENPGVLHDVEKLANAIVDDPPDAASFVAHVLAGGSPGLPAPVDSRIVRMNPMVAPVRDADGNWTLPEGLDDNAFGTLANLALDAVEQDQVLAIKNFASLWLQDKVSNQPIRSDGNLKAELGQSIYSQAEAAWTAIR